MGFILHFYIICGTNLLTGGPTQIAVFFAYFRVSSKRNIKRNETFGNVIFSTNMIQETWSGRQETIEEATRQGACPLACCRLEDSLTWTPSPKCVFWSKKNHREGFIPFGLRLVFLFYETQKQGKTGTGTWHYVNRFVTKNDIK